MKTSFPKKRKLEPLQSPKMSLLTSSNSQSALKPVWSSNGKPFLQFFSGSSSRPAIQLPRIKNSQSLLEGIIHHSKASPEIKKKLSRFSEIQEIGQRKRETSLRKSIQNLVSYGSSEQLFGSSPMFVTIEEKVRGKLPRNNYQEYPEPLVSQNRKKNYLKRLLMDWTKEKREKEEGNAAEEEKGFSFLTEEERILRRKQQKNRKRTLIRKITRKETKALSILTGIEEVVLN